MLSYHSVQSVESVRVTHQNTISLPIRTAVVSRCKKRTDPDSAHQDDEVMVLLLKEQSIDTVSEGEDHKALQCRVTTAIIVVNVFQEYVTQNIAEKCCTW